MTSTRHVPLLISASFFYFDGRLTRSSSSQLSVFHHHGCDPSSRWEARCVWHGSGRGVDEGGSGSGKLRQRRRSNDQTRRHYRLRCSPGAAQAPRASENRRQKGRVRSHVSLSIGRHLVRLSGAEQLRISMRVFNILAVDVFEHLNPTPGTFPTQKHVVFVSSHNLVECLLE